MTVITVLVSAALLFTRLGHYALWDDEAQTALFAQGVWKTGDTSAMLGSNLLASRDGACLTNLKGRYEPPFQHFFSAPFTGLWPGSALAARLPYAVVGLMSVLLIFWWLLKERASLLVCLLTAMGLIGNVSFWLYCRQCRYYSLDILLSILIAFLYLSKLRKWWTIPAISACSTCLFATHYLDYAAIYAVLGIDWVMWGRKRFPLSRLDLLWLWVPQMIVGAFVLSIWNPFAKVVNVPGTGGLVGRLYLIWWAWRDMNRCEFGVLLLVAAAPIVWMYWRDLLLLRASVALLVYVSVVEILSPQKGWIQLKDGWREITSVSDVRYLAAVIPLLIAIAVLTLTRAMPPHQWWLALVLGAIGFGTNAFHGGFLLDNDPLGRPQPLVQSTLGLYIAELVDPPTDPYTPVAAWINANIPSGRSVLVYPDYMVYPLMFHAPKVTYAWQLPYPPDEQFKNLPLIHFRGQTLPDYLICFGPIAQQVFRSTMFPQETKAQLVATIDVFWRDLYRPEILWRVFRPIKTFNRDLGAIHIWRFSKGDVEDFHL